MGALSEHNSVDGGDKGNFDALEIGGEIEFDIETILTSKKQAPRDRNIHASFEDSFSSIKDMLSIESIHESGQKNSDWDAVSSSADAPHAEASVDNSHTKKRVSLEMIPGLADIANAQNADDVQAMIKNLLGSMEAGGSGGGGRSLGKGRKKKSSGIPPVTNPKSDDKDDCEVASYFNKIDSRTKLNKAASGGGTRRSLRRKKTAASSDDLMDKFLSLSTTKQPSAASKSSATNLAGKNAAFGL